MDGGNSNNTAATSAAATATSAATATATFKTTTTLINRRGDVDVRYVQPLNVRHFVCFAAVLLLFC